MPLVVKDRVKETTLTTGTGTLTLAGAVQGFQSFAVIGNANTTYYTIVDAASGDWEVGVGTYTASGTTLSRDTVLESSNANSLVNFGAGAKDVFVTYPADFAVFSNNVAVANVQEFATPGTSTWTKPASANFVMVEMWGGGGSGGAGARGSALNGGSGGGGGAYAMAVFPASTLGATVSVSVGGGGSPRTGSSGVTGLSGLPGGTSSFGTLLYAYGGGGGQGGRSQSTPNYGAGGGGTASAGATNAAGGPFIYSGTTEIASAQFGGAYTADAPTRLSSAQGAASAQGGAQGGGCLNSGAGGAGGCSSYGGPGGGGGAGSFGGSGGAGGSTTGFFGGGAAGGAVGGSGGSGGTGRQGGGGGAGNTTTAAAAGGAGGQPGGGGGGGGSNGSVNGGNSGTGGSGMVRVYSW